VKFVTEKFGLGSFLGDEFQGLEKTCNSGEGMGLDKCITAEYPMTSKGTASIERQRVVKRKKKKSSVKDTSSTLSRRWEKNQVKSWWGKKK